LFNGVSNFREAYRQLQNKGVLGHVADRRFHFDNASLHAFSNADDIELYSEEELERMCGKSVVNTVPPSSSFSSTTAAATSGAEGDAPSSTASATTVALAADVRATADESQLTGSKRPRDDNEGSSEERGECEGNELEANTGPITKMSRYEAEEK
jgi:hypothetical protein